MLPRRATGLIKKYMIFIKRGRRMAKRKTKQTNKSFDFILFTTVLLLLGMGIVMVLSASSPSSLATYRKQLFFCV